VTTLYCIDELDESLWVPGMSCGIIAHEQKFNQKIFSVVKRAFENLPEELKPTTKTNTKYAYEFVRRYDGVPLDSSIYVDTDVRSGTVLKLHITEAAWIKDYEKIAAGAKQAVPKNGCISEETTANGFNVFYDDYEESARKEQQGQLTEYDMKNFFYAWFIDPEYSLPGTMPEITDRDKVRYGDEMSERLKYGLTDGQMLWRRWKIDQLGGKIDGVGLTGLQLFRQEYPATPQEAFQSGAGNIFDISDKVPMTPLTRSEAEAQLRSYGLVDELVAEAMAKYETLTKLGVWFWEMPKPGDKYVIGVDPSDGEGADFGVSNVWRKPDDALDSRRQVAQYYGKSRPDVLAEITADIGWFYNEAFVGVENNQLSCILFLVKIYSNYFFETQLDKKTAKKTKFIGWRTSTKTRDPMIDEFVRLYEEDALEIRSRITLSEMKTFVKNEKGKREHAVGKHDDSLFGDFIAQQMIKLEPRRAKVHTSNSL
jgi:hypothetical protein